MASPEQSDHAKTARQQQVRLHQAVLVLFIDLGLIAVAWTGVWLQVLAWPEVFAWSMFSALGAATFVLIIHSRLNLRFVGEPALTLPQALLGVVSSVFAYAVTGPVRGATLLSVALAIVFGMFALSPRQVTRLCALALGLLGAEMLVATSMAPARFPPRVEAMHFLIMALVLPSIALLTGQLSTMREKMSRQRTALEEALAKNYELASHDELTGLRNRRSILELMDVESRRCRRDGSFLSFAILDIDFFKRVNDTHGHGAGDEVLKSFASLLTGILRDTDSVARWGGEEFLVLFPATSSSVAALVLERFRAALEQTTFLCNAQLRIAFSAGIAQHATNERVEQTIERADSALYSAKSRGRNRTVASECPHATAARGAVAGLHAESEASEAIARAASSGSAAGSRTSC